MTDAQMEKERTQLGIVEFILTAKNSKAAAWSVAYAYGHPKCGDVSMKQRSIQLGLPASTISQGAVRFIYMQGLKPSPYMKSKKAKKIVVHTKAIKKFSII